MQTLHSAKISHAKSPPNRFRFDGIYDTAGETFDLPDPAWAFPVTSLALPDPYAVLANPEWSQASPEPSPKRAVSASTQNPKQKRSKCGAEVGGWMRPLLIGPDTTLAMGEVLS